MSEENTNVDGAAGANPETATTDDVFSVLKHDPFPGGEMPKAKAEEKSTATATAPAEKTVEKVADKGTPDPEKEALRQSLTHATDLIEAYKQKPTASAAKPESAKEEAPTAPTYDFVIPDQLVTAMTSNDPVQFKAGLAGYAKGIATGVHKQMEMALPKVIEKVLQAVLPQMVRPQIEQHNSTKAIQDDFYGTFKELNDPRLYDLVSKMAGEVMQEAKTDRWSPAIRDAVGKRVKDFLGSLGGAPAEKAKTNGHPAMFGGNNSRQTAPVAGELERDIADTLFG